MADNENRRTGLLRRGTAAARDVLARWRGLFTGLAIGGAVLLAVLGSALVLSPRPSSCTTCHEMQAHYDQWAASTHKGVSCIDCHTEPGLSGVIKIEASMFKNASGHVAGVFETPIRADVRDDSCLRCHPRESRPEILPQATLRISHSAHNDIACAQCHGRLVHNLGQETTVPPVTHKGGEKACVVCHTPEVCPHGSARVDCQSCHSASIPRHTLREQSNVITREACIDCHNKMRVDSEENCQTCHVSPHGIDRSCNTCHTSTDTWNDKQLVHPFPLEGAHAAVACTKCHDGGNPGAQELAKAKVPATLPLATKTAQGGQTPLCGTCHQPPHQPFGDTACTVCHSTSGWQGVAGSATSSPATGFDHAKSWDGFVGKHASASCASCHQNGVYAGTATACATCHEPKPQPHFGTECATCHQTGTAFKRA
ncbi:MAG: NapC/NirT family cytochrome c [Chloroflexota bacterium]